MKQHITIITLAVSDYDTSEQFYTQTLGWKPLEPRDDLITFYDVGGFRFAIYPRDKMAEEFGDFKINLASGGSAPFTLAHNLPSESEVDELFVELKDKGVTIVKMPEKVFWGGYSGYFMDPDQFLWEVAHNPFDSEPAE